jgi:hypothetical protein
MADQFISPLPPQPKPKSIMDTLADAAAAVVASNPGTRLAAEAYNAVTEGPTSPPQASVQPLPDMKAIAALPPEQRQQAYTNALTGKPVEGVPPATVPGPIVASQEPVRLTQQQMQENAAAPPPPVTRGGYGGPDTSHLAALQEQSDRLDAGVQTEHLMQTNETRREAEAAGNESRDMDYDFKQEVDSTKRRAQGLLNQKDQLMGEYLNGKVDPYRLVRSKTTAQKLLGFASAVSSGILLGMGRTQTNQALDRMDKEIEQDNLEQQREIVAKLQGARELGATYDDVMKAMDMSRVLAAGKKEAFWKNYALKLDEIALTHKGSIDKGTHDFAVNEAKRLAEQARLAGIQAAIAGAQRQDKEDRRKASDQAFSAYERSLTTPGAVPVNQSLLANQILATRTGRPVTYKDEKGKPQFLPPAVSTSPGGGGKLNETVVKEHEKAATVGSLASSLRDLDDLFETVSTAGRVTGIGNTGNEIDQATERVVEDLMRVGLTSDKDRAGIARMISRGYTQSQDSYRKGISSLVTSRLNRIEDPEQREQVRKTVANIWSDKK